MASFHFSPSETGPETGVHGRQPKRPRRAVAYAAANAGAAAASAAAGARAENDDEARRASIISVRGAATAGATPTAPREARVVALSSSGCVTAR